MPEADCGNESSAFKLCGCIGSHRAGGKHAIMEKQPYDCVFGILHGDDLD